MATCFLFGNRICPDISKEDILEAVMFHHKVLGVHNFVVAGSEYGMFNALAATALRSAAQTCNITLSLLLYYHPQEKAFQLPDGFHNSVYPPLESVPRRFAISKGNAYMIRTADTVICFVKYAGNSRALLELALRRQAKGDLVVHNPASPKV